MARKRSEIKPMRPDLPIYPIGVAARLLNVHPRTLRIYEEEGLIKPAHKGTRRMFSANDIKWVECLRSMIHEDGISIAGLKKLLALVPCYEIVDCPAEVCESCPAKVDWAVPRTLHQVGDDAAAKEAKQADQKKKKAGGASQKKSTSHLAEYLPGSFRNRFLAEAGKKIVWMSRWQSDGIDRMAS